MCIVFDDRFDAQIAWNEDVFSPDRPGFFLLSSPLIVEFDLSTPERLLKDSISGGVGCDHGVKWTIELG